MSQADVTSAGAHEHGHEAHAHPSFLAHHFDSVDQQSHSAKLGMWVFLATEILMFGGLFCAYAVWRAHNYESFAVGHVYLSTGWGAFNTLLLISSSFTMAWAVRAIQLGRARACFILLALTFIGGLGFMCVKYEEYSTKFEHGMGPGRWYHAPEHAAEALNKQRLEIQASGQMMLSGLDLLNPDTGQVVWSHTAPENQKVLVHVIRMGSGDPMQSADMVRWQAVDPSLEEDQGPAWLENGTKLGGVALVQRPTAKLAGGGAAAGGGTAQPQTAGSTLPKPGEAPAGLTLQPSSSGGAGEGHGDDTAAHADGGHEGSGGDHGFTFQHTPDRLLAARPFFSIYFLMTGLHGLHVLVGMGLIAWIMVKVRHGAFSPAYNTPVDMVGLYWHLVDLIWIFLFPLLYLIT